MENDKLIHWIAFFTVSNKLNANAVLAEKKEKGF